MTFSIVKILKFFVFNFIVNLEFWKYERIFSRDSATFVKPRLIYHNKTLSFFLKNGKKSTLLSLRKMIRHHGHEVIHVGLAVGVVLEKADCEDGPVVGIPQKFQAGGDSFVVALTSEHGFAQLKITDGEAGAGPFLIEALQLLPVSVEDPVLIILVIVGGQFLAVSLSEAHEADLRVGGIAEDIEMVVTQVIRLVVIVIPGDQCFYPGFCIVIKS